MIEFNLILEVIAFCGVKIIPKVEVSFKIGSRWNPNMLSYVFIGKNCLLNYEGKLS